MQDKNAVVEPTGVTKAFRAWQERGMILSGVTQHAGLSRFFAPVLSAYRPHLHCLTGTAVRISRCRYDLSPFEESCSLTSLSLPDR